MTAITALGQSVQVLTGLDDVTTGKWTSGVMVVLWSTENNIDIFLVRGWGWGIQ